VGNPSCKIKDKFRNVIGVFMDNKHNGVERPKHQKGVSMEQRGKRVAHYKRFDLL
jgi:hypothetical protein